MSLALVRPLPARAQGSIPEPDHVLVLIMENKLYDQARVQPYTASLIEAYSSCSNSFALTHPSQPNYLGLWAGTTMNVTSDVCPPPGSPYYNDNLGSVCEAHGISWKAYSEDLPATGSTVCSALSGSYTRKHDPWVDWANVDHSNEVPWTEFAADTLAGTIPRLAFVIPNNCHNGHNCAVSDADAWMAGNVPAMLRAVGGNGVVIVTWDEDDYSLDNHILTMYLGPLVRTGYVSNARMDHYSTLRTICDLLRVPAPGWAADSAGVADVWAPAPTAVADGRPARHRLDPVTPNPGAGPVAAVLHLAGAAYVEAGIHDIAGREVRSLLAGWRGGDVRLTWDGRLAAGASAGSGVYFLRVRVDGQTLERGIVRLR